MTCPGCGRDVTLISGLCGLCSSSISGGVQSVLLQLEYEAEVVDVGKHEDGHYHIRFDLEGGESA